MEPQWATFSVAGVNADQTASTNLRNWMEQAVANPSIKIKVQTVPEPENPYDPLAIRVELNGAKIGYIGRKDKEELLRFFPQATKDPLFGRIETWGIGKEHNLYCQISIPYAMQGV